MKCSDFLIQKTNDSRILSLYMNYSVRYFSLYFLFIYSLFFNDTSPLTKLVKFKNMLLKNNHNNMFLNKIIKYSI